MVGSDGLHLAARNWLTACPLLRYSRRRRLSRVTCGRIAKPKIA